MTRILHIAPRLPPAIDGIGDFASELARRLEHLSGVRNECIASLGHELTAGADDLILLHYSGYGYDPRGVPQWLAEWIERVSLTQSVAIFFHELWASGPPWSRAFYYSIAQKRIVERLARIATVLFTTTPKMQQMLDPRALLTPIPSNMPEGFAPRERRAPYNAVVFAQEHARLRSLQAHSALLRNLGSLHLVGKDAGREDYRFARKHLPAERIRVTPNAPPQMVAEILRASDFCPSFYPRHLVTKSGSLMAAFACGCPVVLARREAENCFDPLPPVIYPEEISPARLAETALVARSWYHEHASWDVLVPRMAAALKIHAESLAA